MTVGSVRGKQRFEIPVLVAQGGRSEFCTAGAMSFGGQVRLNPALTDMVGYPQAAQYGFLAFQSSRCRASAYIAAIQVVSLDYGSSLRLHGYHGTTCHHDSPAKSQSYENTFSHSPSCAGKLICILPLLNSLPSSVTFLISFSHSSVTLPFGVTSTANHGTPL